MDYSIDSATEEEWRDVPGFVGLYQASSLGRIRRIRPSPQSKLRNGYMRVILRDADGVIHPLSAHRVVCAAFNGPPTRETTQAAHLNGIRDDNRPENLAWTSPKENNSHKIAHGTHNIGEKHNFAILTEKLVLEIRDRVSNGEKPKHIYREYGVSYGTVYDVVARRSWRHI